MALKVKVSIEFSSQLAKEEFFDYVLAHNHILRITEDVVADCLCLYDDEYTALADHLDKGTVIKLCRELIDYVTITMKKNCGLEV